MSGTRGPPIGGRGGRGENRFYNPPHIRKQQQQQQLQQQQQQQLLLQQQKQEEEEERKVQRLNQEQQRARLLLKPSSVVSVVGSSMKRKDPDEFESISGCLNSFRESTNLDRFLEYTTPFVPAQYLPKTSVPGWKSKEMEFHPYFVLDDLWESFKEWSAYGAGVPLLLDVCESAKQYYVPYLSAIQLYIDPRRPSPRLRRPGEESDAESSRETSSDGSSDYGEERQQNTADANIQSLNRLSLRNKPLMGSSSDESEISNPPGQLLYEYFERNPPFGREPLASKILHLANKDCPEIRTYRSCDLLPSSWISVAWYPIYRIPTGPTLQNLDACFLTFHSLSTSLQSSDGHHFHNSTVREVHSNGMSFKQLTLPPFGLASYKFKVPFWNHNSDCPKANSLLVAADNWLKRLQVEHPDYSFFLSHMR